MWPFTKDIYRDKGWKNSSHRKSERPFWQWKKGKKTIDEIDPKTEFLIKLIRGEYKIMCHLHKEDDALFLISLVDKFGIRPKLNIKLCLTPC